MVFKEYFLANNNVFFSNKFDIAVRRALVTAMSASIATTYATILLSTKIDS
jgi:hypothetical protein